MATANDLIARTKRIIQDNTYTSAIILDLLNEGMTVIAAGVEYAPHMPSTPPLPDLITSSAVSTTSAAASVNLPANLQKKLFAVVSSDGVKVFLEKSWIKFLNKHPGLNGKGSVEEVCVRGLKLYYQPIPTSAETLTLHYHRFPTDMTSASNTPDGLPVHLHERALVSYAAKEIYSEIEDGIEQNKVETANYTSKFLESMNSLYRFYGPEDADPDYLDDDEYYIDRG